MSELKTNKISPFEGTVLTLGDSGDNIALASGATATGFGSTSASDLTSGTLPDARFPATLPSISGANLTGISAGKILQMQTAFGGPGVTSTTIQTWHVGGSTRTITMSSATNKILVIASASLYIGVGGTFPIVGFNVRRTLAGVATDDVCDTVQFYYDARSSGAGRGQEQAPATCFGLDAPNSTGELTYQCEFKITGTGYSGNAGLAAPLSIILMEVEV